MNVRDIATEFCRSLSTVMAANKPEFLARINNNGLGALAANAAPIVDFGRVLDLDFRSAREMAEITNFTYPDLHVIANPVIAYDGTCYNSSPTASEDVDVSYSKEMSESYVFSFTEELKLGAKATFKCGLPLIGEARTEIWGEISAGASQGWTQSTTRTWASHIVVHLAPSESAHIEVAISNDTINSPFTARAIIAAGVWFMVTGYTSSDPSSGVDCWLLVDTIFTSDELEAAAVPITGQFKGVEGVSTSSKITPILTR
jgi:hypothetical protein